MFSYSGPDPKNLWNAHQVRREDPQYELLHDVSANALAAARVLACAGSGTSPRRVKITLSRDWAKSPGPHTVKALAVTVTVCQNNELAIYLLSSYKAWCEWRSTTSCRSARSAPGSCCNGLAPAARRNTVRIQNAPAGPDSQSPPIITTENGSRASGFPIITNHHDRE